MEENQEAKGEIPVKCSRGSFNNTIYDGNILNCNKVFWMKNVEDEATNIPKMGKTLGVSAENREREMVNNLFKF